MKLNEVLKTGREILEKEKIDPREARLLLAFVLKVKIEELLKLREISEDKIEEYKKLLIRRAAGEPFAYITGYKEFMKLDFMVNENVLIPRGDTEILVEEVIDLVRKQQEKNLKKESFQDKNQIKILDMCTGSGCIAISLSKYLSDVKIIAVDVSSKALEIAKINAKNNDSEIQFIESNLFNNLPERLKRNLDVIVSNPPYIQTSVVETLQKEVKNEPLLALDGGENGLYFYEEITKESLKYLKNDGVLAFEIGYDQAESVKEIMKRNGFENIKNIRDLSGNDRVVIGFLKG